MNNFEYCNPTHLIFGKGRENDIGAILLKKLQAGDTVLVVYGSKSAEKSGLIDRVRRSLEAAGLSAVFKGGVTPNPQLDLVRDGIEAARECGARAVLAVGGGSVIDASKAIAIGVPYVGDVWDFFAAGVSPKEALPVACVLTLPAAGSEQSIRIVISGEGRKLGAGSPVVRPFASVINPEIFFTLPQKQIRAGVIDMMSHIMERYFTLTEGTDFVDGQAEAAMRTIMRNGLKLMKNHEDYDAWCQVSVAGSFAHNGYYALGQTEDWASHGMEHELSAWDTSITHGDGLAVVIPAWMRYVYDVKPSRFAQFAINVMGEEAGADDNETALKGIEALKRFYREMGAPATLSDLGADKADSRELAEKAVRIPGKLGGFKKLYAEDIAKIYDMMR